MSTSKSNAPTPSHAGRRLLWPVFLGSPVIWLLNFQVIYTLVPYACLWKTTWPLQVTALVSLLLVLANAAWGAGHLRVLARDPNAESDPQVKRARFMARTGVWLSLLFALLIALQGVAMFFLDPCRL